jgi:hypothetical protein
MQNLDFSWSRHRVDSASAIADFAGQDLSRKKAQLVPFFFHFDRCSRVSKPWYAFWPPDCKENRHYLEFCQPQHPELSRLSLWFDTRLAGINWKAIFFVFVLANHFVKHHSSSGQWSVLFANFRIRLICTWFNIICASSGPKKKTADHHQA